MVRPLHRGRIAFSPEGPIVLTKHEVVVGVVRPTAAEGAGVSLVIAGERDGLLSRSSADGVAEAEVLESLAGLFPIEGVTRRPLTCVPIFSGSLDATWSFGVCVYMPRQVPTAH